MGELREKEREDRNGGRAGRKGERSGDGEDAETRNARADGGHPERRWVGWVMRVFGGLVEVDG